jgi:hypothetical protein
LLLIIPLTVQASTLRYAVTHESWEPYWIFSDGQVSGILSDVMQALDAQMDVTLEADIPQPPLRAQKHFREGFVQLECCVNIAWRTEPGQVEVSLWSDPVLSAEEVIIFLEDTNFPSLNCKTYKDEPFLQLGAMVMSAANTSSVSIAPTVLLNSIAWLEVVQRVASLTALNWLIYLRATRKLNGMQQGLNRGLL